MKADLIIKTSGQLVTCASTGSPKRGDQMRDVGIVDGGAVAVADGKIINVGPAEKVMAECVADETLDAGDRVIAPGFVDPHTHIVYAGDRLNEFELKIRGAEYLEILASGGGILSTVQKTRDASVEQLVEQSVARLNKMLECGTSTVEIKTGYGLDTETELKILAVIEVLDKDHYATVVPTFLAAHTVPPEFRSDSNGYVDLICDEMLPLAWKWYEQSHFALNGRPFFCDVFTEKNAFDLEQSKRILETARSLGFRIKAHVEQFTSLGGSSLAIELNAASIDHLDAISDQDIANLAVSNTVGVVIPTENFNAGKSQFAPARKLIDAGCAVAISTDYNPGSAPCPSMPMAMAIACRYQKLLPSEAMNAATVNAAFAMGLGKTHGSIEVGKQADLLIFDCEDYRHIAYEFGGNNVDVRIKDGVITGDELVSE